MPIATTEIQLKQLLLLVLPSVVWRNNPINPRPFHVDPVKINLVWVIFLNQHVKGMGKGEPNPRLDF